MSFAFDFHMDSESAPTEQPRPRQQSGAAVRLVNTLKSTLNGAKIYGIV
jgi:hypothetical protein